MSDFSVILNNQQQPIPLYKGNRLYSFYAPEKEVARYIDLKYTNKKSVIVIGDVGYYLTKALYERNGVKNILVIIPKIECLDAPLLEKNIPECVSICKTLNKDQIILQLEKWLNWQLLFDTQILVWENSLKNIPMLIDICQLVYSYFSQRVATLTTSNYFGFNWIKNAIHHSLYANSSYQIPMSKKTVALVASGASLNNHIGFLKEKQNELTIICVSSALKTLFHHKVKVDYVVATDGGYHAKTLLVPLEREIKNHPPLLITTLHSAKTKYFATTLINQNSSIDKALGEFHQYSFNLPETPSVSCTALLIARKLSSLPLLVFGLDLDSENEKIHATPHPSYDKAHNKSSKINPIQNQLYSNYMGSSLNALIRYREWFIDYQKEDKQWFRVETNGSPQIDNVISIKQAFKLLSQNKNTEISNGFIAHKKKTITKNEIIKKLCKHKESILLDFYPNFDDNKKEKIWNKIVEQNETDN